MHVSDAKTETRTNKILNRNEKRSAEEDCKWHFELKNVSSHLGDEDEKRKKTKYYFLFNDKNNSHLRL